MCAGSRAQSHSPAAATQVGAAAAARERQQRHDFHGPPTPGLFDASQRTRISPGMGMAAMTPPQRCDARDARSGADAGSGAPVKAEPASPCVCRNSELRASAGRDAPRAPHAAHAAAAAWRRALRRRERRTSLAPAGMRAAAAERADARTRGAAARATGAAVSIVADMAAVEREREWRPVARRQPRGMSHCPRAIQTLVGRLCPGC
jgi:hypothetical protein